MRVRRSIATLTPLAAAVVLALGSLIVLILDEDQSYNYDHLRRQLSTVAPLLTDEQIQLRESLVCSNYDEEDAGEATTIFLDEEPEAPYDGCFISAIFGLSSDQSDRPLDASTLREKYPHYAFLMFTNLVDLEAKGWHKVLHFDASKKRMVTLSRYPKFLGWKEEFVQKYCPVVYYLDGAFTPMGSEADFHRQKEIILQSNEGYVQNPHKPLKKEMVDIVAGHKDTSFHMGATLDWMRNQEDFTQWHEPRRVYLNSHFGYDPKSPSFQRATQFFWDVYSKEQLSWRDQPLWGYTTHHFRLHPHPFSNQRLFIDNKRRQGGRKGGHVYDGDTETEVIRFVNSVCMKPVEERKTLESALPSPIQSSEPEQDYCSTKGSLHQIALDMIQHSSPPGSPSLLKLKHVLDGNPQFFNKLYGQVGKILAKNQEGITRMLMGYGLQHITDAAMARDDPKVTLVEGIYSKSLCPIDEDGCKDRFRIYVQSEQHASTQLKEFLPKLQLCHESANCIIIEYSDFNLGHFEDMADSIILLPVMTQSPSRLAHLEPPSPKELKERSADLVLFGTMTSRRKKFLRRKSTFYLQANQGRVHAINTTQDIDLVSDFYKEAKVCLLGHAYTTEAAGEYHRYSEFAPFGCVPVMEHFSDKIGIEKYERCGGAVFAGLDNLFETALQVVDKVNAGEYEGVSNRLVAWWKAGIQWEQILPTVFSTTVASA